MNGKIFRLFGKSIFIIIVLFIFNHNINASNLNVRIFDHNNNGGYTRIVFENEFSFLYFVNKNLEIAHLVEILEEIDVNTIKFNNNSTIIDNLKIESTNGKSKFLINSKYSFVIWRSFVLQSPFRLVIDVKKYKTNNNYKANQRSNKIKGKVPEIKTLNEKKVEKKKDLISIICIDPGHGGENYGAVGRYLKEKDVTLKISRELKKIITTKLKIKVIMTRNSNIDISLNKRAEIANINNADLFISIHVNSSSKGGARGPETFFVSLNATDKESFELAKKENMSFKEIEKKVETDALKMILWNMAQTDYIRDASKLAEFIQQELNIFMNTRNRGVKQAPFRVLMRASMPAVLLEVGFISNRNEEKMMRNKEFYEKAALAVYKGLKKYIKK